MKEFSVVAVAIAIALLCAPQEANAQAAAVARAVRALTGARVPAIPFRPSQSMPVRGAILPMAVTITGEPRPELRTKQRMLGDLNLRSALSVNARPRPKAMPTRQFKPAIVDPVMMVSNQSIQLGGVMLSPVTITARKSTIVALLSGRGAATLICDDLLSLYINGLPPSIARNARPARVSIPQGNAYIWISEPGDFILLADSLGSGAPPPPPATLAGARRPGGTPPPPPGTDGPLKPNAGGKPDVGCELSGKICYDPLKQTSSMSLSCGPISLSLTSEGKMSMSMKIVG